MVTKLVRTVTGLVLCGAAGIAQTTAEPMAEYEAADRRTVRLPVSAFPQLPDAVRTELQRRRCRVPQVYSNKNPHNVVSGEFVRKGQTDWAVLCSVARVSTILVFPSGATHGIMKLARGKDIDTLQGVGLGKIGYSRGISRARPAWILRHDTDGTAGRISHDGIDDAFVEKASVVWYFRGGRWLSLQGAD